MKTLTTLEEKKAYFEQVKLTNFRESARLEGINTTTTHLTSIPKNRQELEQAKQAVLIRIPIQLF